jgi:hypothetical protein
MSVEELLDLRSFTTLDQLSKEVVIDKDIDMFRIYLPDGCTLTGPAEGIHSVLVELGYRVRLKEPDNFVSDKDYIAGADDEDLLDELSKPE